MGREREERDKREGERREGRKREKKRIKEKERENLQLIEDSEWTRDISNTSDAENGLVGYFENESSVKLKKRDNFSECFDQEILCRQKKRKKERRKKTIKF